jgi:histidine kinase/DNA gyrase B/HSP90-like ATPase
MPKITVHEKALAHLSRGLYRSPASALRELVSNAWDANATTVTINTNNPLFYQLSIKDNGDGFTRIAFKKIMEGGIGSSSKRTNVIPPLNNRPVIGRLGIGLLGIAQICGSFTIVSKPRSGTGFRAKVQLTDLLKEKLDVNDVSVVASGDDVSVGEYDFEPFDPSEYENGTQIITNEVNPTFVKSFQSSLQHPQYKPPPLEWPKAVKIMSGVRSIQELGDYWRLLWELSVACPLPYLSARALPDGLNAKEDQRISHYDFRVIVDGIDLKKPVMLKGNPGGYTAYAIQPQSKKIYGKSLRYHGYLLLQEGAQLRPDELRGILVRIKDIGIGYYDTSMLDYRYNEGPRSRWLTGEVYVDEGLEDALNIDRDSFNRFHPEFRTIQEDVHRILHTEIFPVSYKKIDLRSSHKKSEQAKNRFRHLKQTINTVLDLPVKVSSEPIGQKSSGDTLQESIPQVKRAGAGLELHLPSVDTVRTKKTYRQLAASILGIFELVIREKEKERQRKLFYELLLRLLERW